jgi:hypothetical protein
MPLNSIRIDVCDVCLDNRGECSDPRCVFWLTDSPSGRATSAMRRQDADDKAARAARRSSRRWRRNRAGGWEYGG